MAKDDDLKKGEKKTKVGAGNFVSQLFFFWVFPFIWKIRRVKDLKELFLTLRKSETAQYNDKKLEKNWKKEITTAAKQNR
jgi:hypothetical protein